MKAKLITDGNKNYSLLDYNNELVATTMESGFTNQKLSLKNCQAIELGYDLDELAENFWKEEFMKPGLIDTNSYKEGFQKALEILGDKKFSEEDIDEAFDAGHEMLDSPKNYNDSLKEFKESLQQTEWDVEVEMRSKNIDELRESNKGFLNNSNLYIPKLDADGCLILKRI